MQDRPWLVIDFETVSLADLKKCGAYRYAIDPTTEPLCFACETRSGRRGLWKPGDPNPFPPDVMETYTFVAHNAGFERAIWTEHMVKGLGWPEVPLSRWHCTQARALQLALPAQLEKVLKALRLPMEKDKEGSKLTISLSKPNRKTGMLPQRTPEILERVYAYCISDIDGEVALHKRLGWLPPEERVCWEISQQMNDMGLGLDMEFVAAAQQIVDDASKPLVEEFRELTGGLSPNQRDKVLAWCREKGVAIPNMTKATLAEMLGDEDEGDDDPYEEADEEVAHVDLPPDVERALRIRQLVGSASIKKLAAMRACVGWDGRARGLLVYHGTTPGRQTAKIVQPHNFPRGTVKVDGSEGKEPPDPLQLVSLIKTRDYQLLEAVYGVGAVEIIVSSLRHAIVPAADHVLLAGDYAGIQLRTVLALAGQHDKTALMAANDRKEIKYNAYIEMAELIYHRKIDKVADLAEYTIGKNAVLGLGFQGAGGMFQTKMAPKESREFCDEVVRVYRKEWAPAVPPLWYALQQAATDAVWSGVPHEAYGVTYSLEDIWLKATIHNGTSIYYAYPEKCREQMPWDPAETRRGFTYYVMKKGQWMQRHAFGGQLTENVVMKIEREIIEGAKRRLVKAGYRLPFEVHDEALAEVHEARLDEKEFRAIMEAVEPWVHQLKIPIAVETWAGPRYKK